MTSNKLLRSIGLLSCGFGECVGCWAYKNEVKKKRTAKLILEIEGRINQGFSD